MKVFNKPQQLTPHWEVRGFRRGPGRPRTNSRGDLRKMEFTCTGRGGGQQLSTDKNGVVWPNVFTWTWAESRSKVKVNNDDNNNNSNNNDNS